MISRRDFLALGAGCSLLVGSTGLVGIARSGVAPERIGLALGGGGAKGLAHIPVLELFDELGLRPHRIAGTSIGSVMGALYASGLSGREIRELFDRLLIKDSDTWRDIVEKRDVLRWLQLIDLDVGEGGLIGSDAFLAFLAEAMRSVTFDGLKIPLQVVAADLWSGEQVVLAEGDLLGAVKASIALPGLFAPVAYGAKHLVDGGVANPVPYDLLLDDCDLVVAVDVLGQRVPETDDSPSFLTAIFATFTNMQRAIFNAKLERAAPHVLIQPELVGIRVLEFYKAEEVYRQAELSIAAARQQIQALLHAATGVPSPP